MAKKKKKTVSEMKMILSMRFILLFISFLIVSTSARSQSDSMTNSFEEFYKKNIPALHYNYDNEKSIHNYSGNWDFDKDGQKDQLYFIGTGGAHLYYFLRVVLSSDNIVQDFPFIESDFPVLPKDYELNKTSYKLNSLDTYFSAFNDLIFIKLDEQSFSSNKKVLTKKGIKSNLVVIHFKDGKAVFSDFSLNE